MKKFAFLFGLLLSLNVYAGTFNLFSPATGVLKGNSSTYVTSAATSSDIRSMWTGTCNSGTFLRGDGACASSSVTGFGNNWDWATTSNQLTFTSPLSTNTFFSVVDDAMNGVTNYTVNINGTVELQSTDPSGAGISLISVSPISLNGPITCKKGVSGFCSLLGDASNDLRLGANLSNVASLTATSGHPKFNLYNDNSSAIMVTMGDATFFGGTAGDFGLQTASGSALAMGTASGSNWPQLLLSSDAHRFDYNGGGGQARFVVGANSTSAALDLIDSNSSTDTKTFRQFVDASTIHYQTCTDALTCTDYLSVVNSAGSPTSVTLAGSTALGFTQFTGPTSSVKTFTLPNASATILTSNAAVTVAQGGTGVGTLTAHGVLLGEGTSNVSSVAAMAADTVLQGKGATNDPAAVSVNNCGDSSHALSYSTSTHTFGCQAITATATPAGSNQQIQFNNSGAFGASAFMTWDGSNILLSQDGGNTGVILSSAIGHIEAESNSNGTASIQSRQDFTGTVALAELSAVNDNVNGPFIGSTSSGFSGTHVTNGPSGEQTYIASHGAIPITIGINGTEAMRIFSTRGVTVGAPTGGDKGAGTLNAENLYVNGTAVSTSGGSSSTFTGTGTGFSGSVTCTIHYQLANSVVTLFVDGAGSCTGTSNSTSFTITGLPGPVTPTHNVSTTTIATDNGADNMAGVVITNGGVLTFYLGTPLSSTGWTASGTKGITTASITYGLRN